MKIHEKIGEVTGRKLYSTDKNVWFANKTIAIQVGLDKQKREEKKK